jgi:hypothetical protein
MSLFMADKLKAVLLCKLGHLRVYHRVFAGTDKTG